MPKSKRTLSEADHSTAEELAGIVGVTPRQIRLWADEGVIPKAGRAQFPKEAAYRGMFKFYREASSNVSDETRRHKARREAAEANNSELETIRRRGDFRVYARAVFADGFVKLKTAIESATYLSPEQRDKLFADIHAIVLTEPEPE